jgi:UDP-N-acetylglucosamine acyltransferase
VPRIHPTALVDRAAELAADVEVGAYAIVGPHVRAGAGTVVGPHAVVTGRTSLGERNRIFQFASIGEVPQDRKYGGEPTTTVVGDDNVFREFVSVHAGTAQDRGTTTIGSRCLLLNYVHVAHDCAIGDDVTVSNCTQLAGHVAVGNFAVFGGMCAVHQFCRVGAHAMVGGGSMVVQDVPPFVTVHGYPAKPVGTNTEGLRRRGFTPDDVAVVRRAYKTLYREGRSFEEAKAELATAAAAAPVLAPFVEFLAVPGRGIVR